MPLLLDNNSAIATASTTSINARNKHIDIRYHFIRGAILQKKITLRHQPTSQQTADILTKALMRILFTRFRRSMGMVDEKEAIEDSMSHSSEKS